MDKWIIHSKKEILRRRIFSINDLECSLKSKGIDATFSTIDTADWVNIVPITSDGKILFVKQHRLGTDEITLETPGGIAETGEDMDKAARRELIEETGFSPENIRLMKTLRVNPAIMTNSVHLFLATGCTRIADQNLDREENITIESFPKPEVLQMMDDGRINHSIVVAALLFAFQDLDA